MPTPISLPSPPFVDVTGIANFRDIGGYPTVDQSSSIRQELVFRCADPSKIQPDGLAKLKQLRVKKVFDLRSLPEIKKQGPEWNNVEIDASPFTTKEEGDTTPLSEDQIERIWCPVFADADYGPEQVALRYAQYAKQSTQVRLGTSSRGRSALLTTTGLRASIQRDASQRRTSLQDHPLAPRPRKPRTMHRALHSRQRPHRRPSRPTLPPLQCPHINRSRRILPYRPRARASETAVYRALA